MDIEETLKEIRQELTNITVAQNNIIKLMADVKIIEVLPPTCSAIFENFGFNKIACIKACREATNWGLKEAKDWVESMPHTVTPKDGLSKDSLFKLVDLTVAAGGKASIVRGADCDTCQLRFTCYTQR